MNLMWSLLPLVLAVACTEAVRNCRVVKLISNGDRVQEKVSPGFEFASAKIVKAFTPGVCKRRDSFGFSDTKVFADRGCKAIVRVCEEEIRTTQAPLTTEAPKEFCKTEDLWSNPGKTEVVVIEGRNGGEVKVTSVSLLREFSKRVCNSKTFSFRRDRVFVRNGCEGKFRVCYTETAVERTTEAPVTDAPRTFTKTVTLWSAPGKTEVTTVEPRNGGEVTVVSFTLVREFSKNKCTEGKTYSFRKDRVFVRDGCEGKFRIEYTEEVQTTAPAPVTSAPKEFCKTVNLWSAPGKTEVTTVESREGGEVEVQTVTLVREFSKKACNSKTYFARGNRVFVKNGCEGKFRVCYTETAVERTTEAPVTDAPSECRETNMRSRDGRKDTERAREGFAIVNVELVKEFAKNSCVRGKSYGFDATEAFATDGCEGRFQICEEPVPEQLTTQKPVKRCKTFTLWSRPGRTEKEEVGGQIDSIEFIKEISSGVCKEGSTYFFRGNKVFVKDGCEAKIRVCYQE